MRVEKLKRRGLVARYFTLFAGEVISKLCVLLAFVYLARILGPRDFGVIELALSTTVLFVLGAELGLGLYGARVVETSPQRASQLIPRAGLVSLMLAVPAYLIMLLWSPASDAVGPGLLAVYGLVVLLTPFNTRWVFQGLRQMQWVAAATLLRYGVFAALVFVLVRPGTDLRVVAVAEVGGALALALFNTTILTRVLRIRFDWSRLFGGAMGLFREAWFLGASDLAWMAMWLLPPIVMGWIDPVRTEQVAWIAAAVRIAMALHTFVWLYFFNLLPNLSRELHDGLDGWSDLVRRSLAFSMWPACLAALAGMLLSPVVVMALFGPAYLDAVLPFQIVIWMIPISCVSGHFRYSLIGAGRQDLDFRAAAAGAVTAVVVAIVAGREYGAPGAAVAVVAAGLANASVAAAASFRALGRVSLGVIAPAIIACGAAAATGYIAGELAGQLAGGVIAGVLYAAVAATRVDLAHLSRASGGRS